MRSGLFLYVVCVLGAPLFLSGCGKDSLGPGHCSSGDDCDAGFACVSQRCVEICSHDFECSGHPAQICRNEQCVDAEPGSCTDVTGCYDTNPCTDKECNADGQCVYTNLDKECDDQDPCTQNDWCANGACGGTAFSCDDTDECTLDSCDGFGGCVHQFVSSDTCACQNNGECDDNDACTDQECDDGTCIYTASSNPDCCNTLHDCAGETPFCIDNVCVECDSPSACEDSDICTEDICNNDYECENLSIDLCCETSGDCGGSTPHCFDDECVECTDAGHCNDGEPCTTDSCDSTHSCRNMNECDCIDDPDCAGTSTPYCEGNDCVECRNAGHCNDDNACTTDTCDGNSCNHQTVSECCNNHDECTADVDKPYCIGHVCVECRFTTDCTDDEEFCTGDTICTLGTHECSTTGDPCSGTQPECIENEDMCSCTGTSCPDEFCDFTTGQCGECVDAGDCQDGEFCTGFETCTDGVCTDGAYPCVGGYWGCEEEDQACLGGCDCTYYCLPSGNTCSGGPVQWCDSSDDCCVGVWCDDGNPCTVDDVCDASKNCTGDIIVCDEAPNICQDSSGACVEGGCLYPKKPNGLLCSSSGMCVNGECTGN